MHRQVIRRLIRLHEIAEMLIPTIKRISQQERLGATVGSDFLSIRLDSCSYPELACWEHNDKLSCRAVEGNTLVTWAGIPADRIGPYAVNSGTRLGFP